MTELREENFLREAVETAAVARVARIRSEAQLARLSRNLRLQQLLVEDGDFHGGVAGKRRGIVGEGMAEVDQAHELPEVVFCVVGPVTRGAFIA